MAKPPFLCKCVLQGESGSGKSTICNFLINHIKNKDANFGRNLRSRFEVSSEPESKTRTVKQQSCGRFCFEDHPGMSDTFGMDQCNWNMFFNSLQKEQFNVILFVMEYKNPRMNVQIVRRMVAIASKIGRKVLNHFAIVMTKFHTNDRKEQLHLMFSMLRDVYKQCGITQPSDDQLYPRVFCLDCDPNESSRKMNTPFPDDDIGNMFENGFRESERILEFIQSSPFYVTGCLQQQEQLLPFGSLKRGRTQKIGPLFHKQQQRQDAFVFIRQEQTQQNSKVRQFIEHNEIKTQVNTFAVVQALKSAWTLMFGLGDVNILNELNLYFNVNVVAKYVYICRKESCKKLLSTDMLQKLKYAAYCDCDNNLDKKYFKRKQVMLGIVSSKIAVIL